MAKVWETKHGKSMENKTWQEHGKQNMVRTWKTKHGNELLLLSCDFVLDYEAVYICSCSISWTLPHVLWGKENELCGLLRLGCVQ